LAGGLLGWGIWGLPELRATRRRWATWRARHQVGLARLVALACVVVVPLTVVAVRPDGRVQIVPLEAGRGEAVFVRGPTGQTALVARGRLDSRAVAAGVADRLALWEHKLDVVVALDAAAEAGLAPALARYPADRQAHGAADRRIDFGGGAVLDIYAASDEEAALSPGLGQLQRASGSASPRTSSVALSFGAVWLALIGQPPPPVAAAMSSQRRTEPDAQQDQLAIGLAGTPAVELASDGFSVWRADGSGQP
ncbi:MAG TPA: hypothetical protein VGE94_15565, partial [Chloroflexota bacterium]